MDISDILKTEGGAKALKAKLKSLSEREKESDNYKRIWSATCAAVDKYNFCLQLHDVKGRSRPIL